MQGWEREKAKCLSKRVVCPSAFNLLTATLLKRGLCAPLGKKGLCLTNSFKNLQKNNIKQYKIGLQNVKKNPNTIKPLQAS